MWPIPHDAHVPAGSSAPEPVVVAHRGASAYRAEHTLGAYALALAQGAGGVECDVRLSRDGQLVCVHDRTVNRTSDGRGVVSTLTLSDLAGLDYGGWHDDLPDSPDELISVPHAVPSARPDDRGLLTLEALLGLMVDFGRDRKLFVETKHPVRYGGLVETKLVAMLARHGLAKPATKDESPVVVMSFSSRAMRRIRVLAPKLPTVLLLERLRAGVASGALPPWADITGPGINLLRADPGYVERSRAHGHPTYSWTTEDPSGLIPNDPADVLLCKQLGVAYFASSSPALMLDALASR
jgi:glycerophosphoryl diester phosphodiesterase